MFSDECTNVRKSSAKTPLVGKLSEHGVCRGSLGQKEEFLSPRFELELPSPEGS